MSPERKQRLDDAGFVWDATTEAWERGFSKLLHFKELEGHCRVPTTLKLGAYNLGGWVVGQRKNKDSIPLDRKQKLDEVGFVWNAVTEAWEEGFSKLLHFKELKDHCRVPSRFELDGFKLGQWVIDQRQAKDRMTPDRSGRLEDIGFVWDPIADQWEEGFRKLLQFKELEGHCNVSFRFELDGFKLGRWVGKQRAHKDRIAIALKRRLDDIGFVWDPIADQWEEGFRKLLQFKELEGHCRVPTQFKLDGYKLGTWVSGQRAHKDRIAIALKRRLDDIGFVWDPIADQWEEGFRKLLQFKELEGHCKVPARFKLGGYNLGEWVFGRRRTKDNISPDRKQRLDDLGFIWDLKEGKPND